MPKADKKLAALAANIRAGHLKCVDALKNALVTARDVGKHLIEAKKLVQHGQWLHWVADNCVFSVRMAQNYMLVARHYTEVAAASAGTGEWRLTSFMAIAQKLEWKRRGKYRSTTPTEKKTFYPTVSQAITVLNAQLEDLIQEDDGDLAARVENVDKLVSLQIRLHALASRIDEVLVTTKANRKKQLAGGGK